MKKKLNSTAWGIIAAVLGVLSLGVGIAQQNAADNELEELVEAKVNERLALKNEEESE